VGLIQVCKDFSEKSFLSMDVCDSVVYFGDSFSVCFRVNIHWAFIQF
jgi:hypothetical protein